MIKQHISNEQTVGLTHEQRTTAAQHEAVLAAIADGVILSDKNHLVILANQAAYRILNLGSRARAGEPVCTLFETCGPNSQAKLRQAMQAITLRADRIAAETRSEPTRLLLQETNCVIQTTLTPVRDEEARLAGTVIVLHDVTAEREVSKAKNEFVSLVSHELRTPMTSIKGYTDLLLKGAVGSLNEQQHHFMSIVKSNVDRMAELVSDLLDVSRIEAGRVRLVLERLDLAGVIYEISEELTETMRQRELALQFDLAPGLPRVRADRNRVIQVLLNLLSNAYRYTPAGGTITVAVHASNGEVQVDVVDTGIGIPEEDQEAIFERFYRADHPVVQQQAGTGLGLSIARSLIELHGGRLWLCSQVNEGSTFSFTLPLYTEEPALSEQDSLCEARD